mmetsp:Transcript_20237/g.43218  ORF Transcript_20237/g.43218 Transcript_20237/m.43218 type:complete len:153 (-) Transcript_20237:31-489(-)
MASLLWDTIAAKLKLLNKSYGENDEGDYDYYSIFQLEYNGTQVVWKGGECRSSNVSMAWGAQMTAELSPDCKTLLVRVTNVEESIGSSKNTRGREERLSVFDLLKEKGVLTEEELTALEGVATGKDEGYEPAAPPKEKGSTWQLHSDPFATS